MDVDDLAMCDGQDSLFDLPDAGEDMPDCGWEYEAVVGFLGTPDTAGLPGGVERSGTARWEWLTGLARWPGAPAGAVLVSLQTEDDVARPLWDAVEALEESGIRVTEVRNVVRQATSVSGARAADDAAAAVNTRLARRPGHELLADLETARTSWLERAGITTEPGLEQVAQIRVWWEQFPDGDDGSGQLRKLAALYGRCVEGR